MKKNILIYGLISGLTITAFMIYGMYTCYNDPDFESSKVVGFAAMIIAFSFIFIAVKNFRDKENGGEISFGKAFKIGLFVSLIASSMYVAAWVIDYYVFMPDFMDKYCAHALRELKAGGANAAEIESKTKEMAGFKELYKNPLLVVLFTYMEILPVGLIISLIAAFVLKKKKSSLI